MIPIRNLYYLLCYAWSRLDEKDFVDISALPRQDLPNLLSKLLVNGVTRILRRGIDRSYVGAKTETSNPRGKIDVTASIKSGLLAQNSVVCLVDDLSRDVLHNQIVRTTLYRLSETIEIEPSIGHELRTLVKQLEGISLIDIRAEHFSRIQLHRNTSFYRFLIHVCELCFLCLLADEEAGHYRFKDFVRDEVRMRKVFQDFVFNFYRIEQRQFEVSSERLRWDITSTDEIGRSLIPEMSTDVCLDNASRKIVIECKFTPQVLQENWGKLSARSEHLYQLFAYLKHLERRGGAHEDCDGLLLYPAATQSVDFTFVTMGHSIRVATLDLRQDWHDIRAQLLKFLEPWKPDQRTSA